MSIVEKMMEFRLVDITVADAAILYVLFKTLGIGFNFVDALIWRFKYKRRMIVLDDDDDDEV